MRRHETNLAAGSARTPHCLLLRMILVMIIMSVLNLSPRSLRLDSSYSAVFRSLFIPIPPPAKLSDTVHFRPYAVFAAELGSSFRSLSLVANQCGRMPAAPKSGGETVPNQPTGSTCGVCLQVSPSSTTRLGQTLAQIKILLNLLCMCADNSAFRQEFCCCCW